MKKDCDVEEKVNNVNMSEKFKRANRKILLEEFSD